MIDHCFSINEQIITWKVCLPPFDFNHNVLFFQSKLLWSEEKQNYFVKRDKKIFLMKNLIEIWPLQIGEQFNNKETVMKCLQNLTDFF